MHLDGPIANYQPFGDIPIRFAIRNQDSDLAFAVPAVPLRVTCARGLEFGYVSADVTPAAGMETPDPIAV